MVTEILIVPYAALLIALGPMSRCGVIYDVENEYPVGQYLVALPVTGTPDEIDCAVEALQRGDGSDPIRPQWAKGGDAGARSGDRSRLGQEHSVVTGAAHPQNAASRAYANTVAPDWFGRCWSDGVHPMSPSRGATWHDLRTRDEFLWGVSCDATTCWGVTARGVQVALPLDHCQIVQPLDRSGCLTGGTCPPEPAPGYPVRFVRSP